MTYSNGVSPVRSPVEPLVFEENSESDWPDFSIFVSIPEETDTAPLTEHDVDWLDEDQLVSEVAQRAGLAAPLPVERDRDCLLDLFFSLGEEIPNFTQSEIKLIFQGLEQLINQKRLTAFSLTQTKALAAMIAAFQIRPLDEGYLPILTFHIDIPGLVDALLTSTIPPSKRIEVCACWTSIGTPLSPEARPLLARCLKELLPSIAPMQMAIDDVQLWPEFKRERKQIIITLRSFCFLMRGASLSHEEIESVDSLLKELLGLSPSPEDIKKVFVDLLRFYKNYPAAQLQPLEEVIASLLIYAVDHLVEDNQMTQFWSCLIASYPRDHILTFHGKSVNDSTICRRFAEALKKRLNEIYMWDQPPALRIAAAFVMAGLLSDIPLQEDCAEAIRMSFQKLAETIPGDLPKDLQLKSLEDLAQILFQNFPFDDCMPIEICNTIIGFAMLGCNALLPGFKVRDMEQLDAMLNIFNSKQGHNLSIENFDLLVWLSNLAEKGKLAPLKGAGWMEPFIEKFISYISGDERHGSIAVAMGKLAAVDRFPLMTTSVRGSLDRLIRRILKGLDHCSPDNCCEVLHGIGWLYHKGILKKESALKHHAISIPLLVKMGEFYGYLTQEHKIKLFFFLTSLAEGNDLSARASPEYVDFVVKLRMDCLGSRTGQNILGKRKRPI